MKDFARRAKEFLAEQDAAWPMLHENRALLARAPVRSFPFDGFTVRVQLNLARMVYARKRPGEGECFLCDHNRPAEQKYLDCADGFRLMCNPFPILPEHFTIVHQRHSPQRIGDCIGAMIELAKRMGPDFTIFYNGPQCGASAPNHLHLQAGTSDFFPANAECPRMAEPVAKADGWGIWASDRYLRRFFTIESPDPQTLLAAFERVCTAQHRLQPEAVEPMMNILCSHREGAWKMIIFPRGKHRPSVYYGSEDQRLLLSIGAVDVGGVLILPDESHFHRITSEQIAQAYGDVTLGGGDFAAVIGALR